MHDDWSVRLIRTELIRPNEHHDEARVLEVLASIEGQRLWTVPLMLERDSLAVMDGHHRLAAARRLSLARVPCVLLDYRHVRVEARRRDYHVDARQITARSWSGNLYPVKTTRHIFSREPPSCHVALDQLIQD